MVANPIHLTLNLTINMRKTVISCLKTPTDPLTKGMLWRWIGGHKKPFLNVELQQLLKRQHQEPLKLKSKRKGSPRKTCHSSINQKIIQRKSGRNQWSPRDMDLPKIKLRVKMTTATIFTDKTTATRASIFLNQLCPTCQQPVFQEEQSVLLIPSEVFTLLSSSSNRDLLWNLICIPTCQPIITIKMITIPTR